MHTMTVSALAILPIYNLNLRNANIGKRYIQPRSGIEECNKCQRIDESARFRIDMTARQRVKNKRVPYYASVSAQESHGHDVLFPPPFNDEGHPLKTDP